MNAKVFLLLVLFPVLQADVRQCACDIAKPETLDARECSLCKEVENSPANIGTVLVKDINPRKPNRWLALPRKHYPGGHPLSAMLSAERTAFWITAIRKAKELWGDEWGLAVNGDEARTQCHGHIHIGKMLDDVDYSGGVFVDSAESIPVPSEGDGIWVHQSGKRLHVHVGEQITETVLMR